MRALIELLAASGASELAVARSSEVLAAALLYLKPMLEGIVGRLTFAASPGSGFRIVPLKFFARHDPLAALQFFCIGCFFSLAAAESNTILGRPAGSFLAGPVFSEAVEVDGFCQAVLAEMSPEPPESVLAGHSPER